MRYNPFQPNKIVAPGMFTGRVDEICTIERALFQTKNLNPQHFLIEGERGIGKSSLLFLVSRFADGRIEPLETTKMNFLVLSVDLAGVTNQVEIVRAIARELKSRLSEIKSVKEGAKKVWEFLSNWEILGVRYHRENNTPIDADEVRDDLILQIAELCTSADCGIDGLFIIIDEADAPPVEAGLGEFLKLFTERLTRRNCNNVLVGLAGLPTALPKLRASHESSPRILTVLSLAPLETEERKQIVLKGLEAANERNERPTTITDDALELLAELSEGYPHFVQQFAFSAFDADRDSTIDVADVIDGAYRENGALTQLGSKYFDEMYHGRISSNEYRKVLNAMAEHGDSWVQRKQIAVESGIKSTSVANAFNTLVGREIILSDPSRRGFYRLPTRSFAAWINAIKSVEEKKGVDGSLFDSVTNEDLGDF